ncbi:hypothetical protein ACFLTE_05655 [Bacteroidota bacterium]
MIIAFPAIICLFVNSTINRHYHVINGHIISHAHPYNKTNTNNSPVESHKHSEYELIFLDQISNFLFILAGIVFFGLFIKILQVFNLHLTWKLCLLKLFSIPDYRAPPAHI